MGHVKGIVEVKQGFKKMQKTVWKTIGLENSENQFYA